MRTFFLLLAFASLLGSQPAHAYRIFNMGRPSVSQRQKYVYMLSGRRLKRPQHPHKR